MSKQESVSKEKLPEIKSSDKETGEKPAPTERDHYVYESIIAEIGY
ncbi:hypothetical protein KKE54_01970 [bacterium]|nr:hypothetical protein [bacterium]